MSAKLLPQIDPPPVYRGLYGLNRFKRNPLLPRSILIGSGTSLEIRYNFPYILSILWTLKSSGELSTGYVSISGEFIICWRRPLIAKSVIRSIGLLGSGGI